MLSLFRTILEKTYRKIIIVTILYLISLIIINKIFPSYSSPLRYFIILVYFIIISEIFILEYYKIKNNLDKNLHYFISYLYSLSFITSNLTRFFEIAEENKDFPYISYYFHKLNQLKKRYSYNYPEAIRYLLNYIPRTDFKGFMERLATAIEVGEELSDFLDREHKAFLEKYETTYRKGLENIRLLQEMSLAFLSSLAFAFTLIIMIPFLTGSSLYVLLFYFGLVFISANITLYYLTKYLVLDDPLWAPTKDKPVEYKRMVNIFFLMLSISFPLSLFLVTRMQLLYAFSISMIPLMYVSYRTKITEESLRKKEEKFAAFFESLFNLSEIFGNDQPKILAHIRMHDFGELNDDIEKLYRRITTSRNSSTSWYYFLSELGSNLAYKVIGTFSKVLEYGSEIKEAGEKLYEILLKTMDLRKAREQFISTFRGFTYGGYIAFVAVLVISFEILSVMYQMFTGLSTLASSQIYGMIGINIFNVSINISLIDIIISIFIIVQAFFSALAISNINGGSKFGMFIDFVILLWIGVGIHYLTFYFFTKVLSQFSFIK